MKKIGYALMIASAVSMAGVVGSMECSSTDFRQDAIRLMICMLVATFGNLLREKCEA